MREGLRMGGYPVGGCKLKIAPTLLLPPEGGNFLSPALAREGVGMGAILSIVE